MMRDNMELLVAERVGVEMSYDPDGHLEYLRLVHGIEIVGVVKDSPEPAQLQSPTVVVVDELEILVLGFDPDLNFLQLKLNGMDG